MPRHEICLTCKGKKIVGKPCRCGGRRWNIQTGEYDHGCERCANTGEIESTCPQCAGQGFIYPNPALPVCVKCQKSYYGTGPIDDWHEAEIYCKKCNHYYHIDCANGNYVTLTYAMRYKCPKCNKWSARNRSHTAH